VADDPRLLELLASSGCAQLLVGLEASHPSSLRRMDSRDWKLRQFDSYHAKITRIQNHGISVNGCFTLGMDEDDTGVFERTRDFVRALDLAEVQITIQTPFPGTALYRRLLQQGRLLRPVFWDQCTLFDVTYRPARMTTDELRIGFYGLVGELYSPSESETRKRKARLIRRNYRPKCIALEATERSTDD